MELSIVNKYFSKWIAVNEPCNAITHGSINSLRIGNEVSSRVGRSGMNRKIFYF